MRGFEKKIWQCYAARKILAKSLLEDAAMVLILDNSWTEESPYKEELALLWESDSLHLPGLMVRRAIRAGRADLLSELFKSDELNLGRGR